MDSTGVAETRFENGYSCSQSVFSALAERWSIGLNVSLRVSAGFGGGIARSAGICGCVTGGIMALGLAQPGVDPEANRSDKEKTYRVCQQFMQTFAERNGSTLCSELLGCDISTPEGTAVHRQGVHRARCTELVRDAVEIVESSGCAARLPTLDRVSESMKPFDMMGREELLRVVEMFAKNWLAHDGCWFLAAEERYGIETAIELDACSWARFAAVEARRIMLTFDIPPAGGLPALEKALGLRLYSAVNAQRVEWSEDRQRLRFFMDECRVQQARRRKGLAAVSVQTGRHGRVPDVRGNHRPADLHYLSALSARRTRRQLLWLGIHTGRQRRD